MTKNTWFTSPKGQYIGLIEYDEFAVDPRENPDLAPEIVQDMAAMYDAADVWAIVIYHAVPKPGLQVAEKGYFPASQLFGVPMESLSDIYGWDYAKETMLNFFNELEGNTMKTIVTMDGAQEILEQINLPGMDITEWYHDGNSMELSDHAIMSLCEAYHRRGLFANEDALTNTIRFGVCRFIGDAMQAWEPEPGTPMEVMQLWQECRKPGDSAALPWQMFSVALPWLLYHAPESLQGVYDDILAEDDRYFVTEVRISYEDDTAHIRIGANWSDIWAIDCEVKCDVTEEEFVRQVNQALPYYMQVEA